jgi:membrane-associated protease RseP (regulator of RpoE activity)
MRTPLITAAITALVAGATPPVAAAPIPQTAEQRVVVSAVPSGGWLGLRSAVLVEIDGATGRAEVPRIRIVDVFGSGPADRAGIREGDEIVGVNGSPITPEAFERLARRLEPGDPVSLRIQRDGSAFDIALAAAARPGTDEWVPIQLQRTLDSTRQVFVRRLDSARQQITATITVEAPNFELRRIQADSARTLVVHADGLTGFVRVEGGEHLFERAEAPTPLEVSAPFNVWVASETPSLAGLFRLDTLDRAPRVLLTPTPPSASPPTHPSSPGRAVAAVRAPTRTLPPAPEGSPRITPEPRSFPTPPGAISAPVRPLAPYVAGMNRVAGAEFRKIEGELASFFEAAAGLLVTDVAEGTPAAEAGLIPGDVIVQARGRNVASIDALRAALSMADDPATLEVVRRGQRVMIRLPH